MAAEPRVNVRLRRTTHARLIELRDKLQNAYARGRTE